MQYPALKKCVAWNDSISFQKVAAESPETFILRVIQRRIGAVDRHCVHGG